MTECKNCGANTRYIFRECQNCGEYTPHCTKHSWTQDECPKDCQECQTALKEKGVE